MSGLENKFVCNFKLAMDMVRGGVRKLLCDMDRSAILKGDLVALFVGGNW